MEIKPISSINMSELKDCSDRLIGANYYSIDQLQEMLNHPKSQNASFVLLDDSDNIQGFRITLAPGTWLTEFDQSKISPSIWPFEKEHTAYFKSQFIDSNFQRQGFGKAMAKKSLQQLREFGTQGVVTHSWKESPSSFAYLEKLGFLPIKEHANFWYELDYDCTLCKKPPCTCTALEMVKNLKAD